MVSGLYEFSFNNPDNYNNLKPFRKVHLNKISKLTCGLFEENRSWNKAINFATMFPSVSYNNFLEHIKLNPPSVAPLSSEQKAALESKRHTLKEECQKIQDLILDNLVTKPREVLHSQYKTLKHLHDEWLNCRFLVKPECINSNSADSFTILRLALRNRFRIEKAHNKMVGFLSQNPIALEYKDRAHRLYIKDLEGPKSFLMLPMDEVEKEISEFQKFFIGAWQAQLSMELPATGIVKKKVSHQGKDLKFYLCRIYTFEQLVLLINDGKLDLLNKHFSDLIGLEKVDESHNLAGYMLNYRLALSYLLFGDRSKFSQDEIDSLFLKCATTKPPLGFLGAEIFPYVSLQKAEIAKAALRFAIDINKKGFVPPILKAHPSMVIDDAKDDDLFWALENGLDALASKLIELGLNADARKTDFNFQRFFINKTTLGNLVLWAESRYHTSDEEVKRIIALARLLIDRGADVNQMMSSDAYSEYDSTIVERCYFTRNKDSRISNELLHLFLSKGAKISPRMAQAIVLEIKAMGKIDFAGYLVEQNYLSEAQVNEIIAQRAKVINGSPLLQETLEAINYLQNAVSKYHLNQNDLDLEKITRIRDLKKKVKALVKSHSADSQLEAQYTTLCGLYDKTVSGHLLLSELRVISQDIRKMVNDKEDPKKNEGVSIRLSRFFGLWSPEKIYILKHASIRAKAVFEECRQAHWELLRNKVISVAERVKRDPYLAKHFITWIHGTQSCSLPVILKLGQLEPLGNLLQANIPTFSGECCGSDANLNSKRISGERLTMRWGEGAYQYFDALTRAHTAYLYATQSRGYRPNERFFNPELCWDRSSVKYVQELLSKTEHYHTFWTVVRLDILRLRSTDPEADKKLAVLKAFIEQKSQDTTVDEKLRKELAQLLTALTQPVAVHLDAQDMKMIVDPKPYGIILASTTQYSRPLIDTKYSPDPLEFVVEGSLKLGTDIQVAFTFADKVDELGKLLSPKGIRVYDFDTLFYLEMMHMIRGSRHKFLEMETLKDKPEPVAVQKKISLALQQDILPHYAEPFPKRVKYRDDHGVQRIIDKPYYGHGIASYEDYMDKINKGHMLARNIHDPMHSTRTCIWSQLVCKLFKKVSMASDPVDIYSLAMAAAAHDLKRQDEGKDFWDRASAKWLKGYLLSRGYTQNQIEAYVHALAEKDPTGHHFVSLVQKCIHDADCLEIMRCLKHFTEFRKSELCFYKELTNLGIDFDKLLLEIFDFIKRTEDPSLKAALEQGSQDHYGDVLRLMDRFHKESGLYPMLAELLKEELAIAIR